MRLTEKDIEMIKRFGGFGQDNFNTDIFISKWENGKRHLLKTMFKDELIIKTPVEFTPNPYDVANDLHTAYRKLHIFDDIPITITDRELREGYYDKTTNASEAAFKEKFGFATKQGMRIVKLIGKICEKLNKQKEFEVFRIEHSKIVNQTFKGTLCLSIHPLDYMTMSCNNHDWTSCLNWIDGCYRGGVSELLSSPDCIISYIESSNKKITSIDWNSKKWRQITLIDPDKGAVCGRHYPNFLPTMNDEVLKMIKKSFDFGEIKVLKNYWYEEEDSYDIDFDTMYNDFSDMSETSGVLAKDVKSYTRDSNLSTGFCVTCGGELGYIDENEVSCMECRDIKICDECSGYYPKEEMEIINSMVLCKHCAPRYIPHKCPFCGEIHIRENDEYGDISICGLRDIMYSEIIPNRYDFCYPCDTCSKIIIGNNTGRYINARDIGEAEVRFILSTFPELFMYTGRFSTSDFHPVTEINALICDKYAEMGLVLPEHGTFDYIRQKIADGTIFATKGE